MTETSEIHHLSNSEKTNQMLDELRSFDVKIDDFIVMMSPVGNVWVKARLNGWKLIVLQNGVDFHVFMTEIEEISFLEEKRKRKLSYQQERMSKDKNF